MKYFFSTLTLAVLLILPVRTFAVVPPPQVSDFTCSAITPTSTSATITILSSGDYNLSGTTNVATIKILPTNANTATLLGPTSTSNGSTDNKQLTYVFSNLTPATSYGVSAFDANNAQIGDDVISNCTITTTAAATPASTTTTTTTNQTQTITPSTTTDECVNAAINDDDGYIKCCSGQSSQDSLGCKNYANYVITESGKSAQCANIISDDIYNSCCSNGSTIGDQAICTAYATRDSRLAPQQTGGTAPSGALTSNPVGTTSNTTATVTIDPALQTCSSIKFVTILDYAIWAKCIIGVVIIPGIFSLAFVVFLWGVFKFIRSSGNATDKEDSKKFIYMGLIGLFVMVSVWGIIKILSATLGIEAVVPTLQTDSLSTSKASK